MSSSFVTDPIIESRAEWSDSKEINDARIDISVECEAGYAGEETPSSFSLCNRLRQVTEVLDRWLTGEYRNFKVKGDDGGLYVLRHVTTANRWEMTLYAGGEC